MSPQGPPLTAVASQEKKQSQSKWAFAVLFLDNCGGSKAFAGFRRRTAIQPAGHNKPHEHVASSMAHGIGSGSRPKIKGMPGRKTQRWPPSHWLLPVQCG